MKLTPLDIRHKEFKRGMRGYADVEVDEFLDEVADEYERLFKENIDLQDRVESLEEKVAGYKRIEETLQKTLVSAQASAEEQKQNASKQAQLILQDAELKARQLANEAYSERQSIEQNMAKLRSAEEDFRFKFKQQLEGYLRLLQETPSAVESAQHTGDFTRHAAAIKEAIAREAAPEEPPTAAVAPPEQPQAAAVAPPEPEPVRAPQEVEAPPAEAPDPAPRAAAPDAEPDVTVEVAAPPAPAAPAASQASAPAVEDERPQMPAPEAARPYVAAAENAPRMSDQSITPARGRGGVQAGRPPAPAETVLPQQRPADDDAEITAAGPRPAAPAQPDRPKERSGLGDADDLLADVDTGVNENEFKW